MGERYPEVEPHDAGWLDVGDGHRVRWECRGNPDGKPAVVVHGGPGAGCPPSLTRLLDPEAYRIVSFDQRGCGRSTPHASDPSADLRHNTTDHLIADMELLRERLGVPRWLLFGGSWGSTLQLAYAQRHPGRVSEIVICGVTTTRRREIDWLYYGVGRFFPAAWRAFRDAAGRPEDGDLLAAYSRLLGDADPAVRDAAARAWGAWEDAVLSQEPSGSPDHYSGRPSDDLLAMTRICAHYFSHGAWLEEGQLISDAGRLAGIPGELLHGRHDLSGPVETAWLLAEAWPDATLRLIDDAGHRGSDTMDRAVRQALDTFAAR